MSTSLAPVATQAGPFPSLSGPPTGPRPRVVTHELDNQYRDHGESTTSTIQTRLRSASKTFKELNPPAGFMIASSNIASSIPSLRDIRRGSYGSEGWSGEGQIRERERRASLPRRGSSRSGEEIYQRGSNNPSSPKDQVPGQELSVQIPEAPEPAQLRHTGAPSNVADQRSATATMAGIVEKQRSVDGRSSSSATATATATGKGKGKGTTELRTIPFDNGYHFPPKHRWTKSTVIGLKAFYGFCITPIGFLVVIYGLNVVAWGGMLFLLLCNASPAMCHPTCNDINSPRRIWIEIDSQILNALFCVTGFGTIPWRFRDLYYLMQYRIQKKEIGLRRLAGINRGWFRLAGSQNLPAQYGPAEIEAEPGLVPESSVAIPLKMTPNAPLTGIRAPPTAIWKLDFVVWTMVWNTFLQAVLSGFMWGMNRYKRPSWSTGLFVALACIVAASGGVISFIEGKHVKAVEGIPVTEDDKQRLQRDREQGITHYNNINDAPPKRKKVKEEKGAVFKGPTKSKDVAAGESATEEGIQQVVR